LLVLARVLLRTLSPRPVYRSRRAGPEHDPLYRVIHRHLAPFLAWADARERPIPAHVEQELQAYLACGRAEHGFTWYRCPECDHSLVLPFSCKGRGFCPSCGGRRMNQLAANLVDHVLPEVPVRQWVLSFPMRVRFLLAWRPELRNEVMGAFLEVVFGWYRERSLRRGESDGRGGAVGVWQLAGGALNLNPHVHALVLDGVYVWDVEAQLPVFRPAPRLGRRQLQCLVERIQARVTRVLRRRVLLDEDAALDPDDGQAELMSAAVLGRGLDGRPVRRRRDLPPRDSERRGLWAWSDWFDLHAGVRISARDREGLERLARYLLRPPLALKRLSELPDGRLSLRLKRPWDDGTTHVLFEPLELLARLSALVPQPRSNLIHYYGVLASRSSWRSQVVPGGEGGGRRSAWIPWATLLSRTFGVDPTICPKCGATLLVRAVVATWGTAHLLLTEVLGHEVAAAAPTRLAPARDSPVDTGWAWA